MNNVLIGITGPSASGKTDFTKDILNKFHNKIVQLINIDSYYKDFSHLSFSERQKNNYDHPNSIDYELLISHIKALKNNHPIKVPVYDYHNHIRSEQYKLVEPGEIYLLEGILLFNNIKVRNLIDVKIYIDTPLDLCIIRRIQQDIKHRGRTLDSVISQYLSHVRNMHFNFIEPTKFFANLIIPKSDRNSIGTKMITYAFKEIITSLQKS